MTLMKFSRPSFYTPAPLDAVNRLQEEMSRFFGGVGEDFGSQFFNTWAPALDLFEEKDNLVVALEVPGMKKDDFEIALHEGVLSISGERRLEERKEKASGYRTERFEGRFQRSVTLPKAVQADKVKASYKDGILTVTLPVAEEARPKQITVSAE